MAGDAGLLRRRPAEGGEGQEAKRFKPGSDAAAVGDSKVAAGEQIRAPLAEPVWSSGVPFYPPSTKFWRIGGKWYDFTPFLSRHPGGAEVLLMARDRFEDCTFAFESHHHNYQKVRGIIRKYEVPEEVVVAQGLRSRPQRNEEAGRDCHHDRALDSGAVAQLLDDRAFYSVLRRRVAEYLRSVGHADGGPTIWCKILFWINFALWVACWYALWRYGYVWMAVVTGVVSSWLGGFGHNWVHQPKYKHWAYLSLDTIGFSSDGWFREHLLQHHMYTNTPWDNHFKGTEPFLVTDPTVERNVFQKYVLPYLTPGILACGLYGNYVAHLVQLLKGEENFSPFKLLMPMEIALLFSRWGWHGFGLVFLLHAVLGNYFFNIALMNHNDEHCVDVAERNKSRDWAVAQLNSSADWAVQSSFLAAGRWLWLNYHTVHHLFPLTDFSHHPAIQAILMDTCKEFGVAYRVGSPYQIYKNMIHSFSSPHSLMQEVMVYAGGL